jgi:hypothetical protein
MLVQDIVFKKKYFSILFLKRHSLAPEDSHMKFDNFSYSEVLKYYQRYYSINEDHKYGIKIFFPILRHCFCGAWWLKPIILATQKAEIRRMAVQG